MNPTRIFSPDSRCRECGCTDVDACMVDLETGDVLTDQTFHSRIVELGYDGAVSSVVGCYWVEPNLCSACADVDAECAAEASPLLFGADGRPLRGAP